MAQPWAKPLYNSTVWKNLRAAALRRDHFTCQICARRATEVHHKIELTEENVNDPKIALNINNLQSLCHNCHTALTMEEHAGRAPDSGLYYVFDSDGMLVPLNSPPVPDDNSIQKRPTASLRKN